MADEPVVEPEPVQLQVGSDEDPNSDRNEKESQTEDKKEDEGERTEKSDLSPKEEKRQTKSRGKRPEKTEPVTPTSERPARERKLVERFSVSPAVRTPTSKGVSIEKGRGTQLKDIPNVAFKLSKRKTDDNLQLLHTLLFGKKAKTHSMKKNIGQFSGYVWGENEEKQRSRIKEKLDKCVKEKLVFLCDVLDIPINKALIKKEELSVKLLEFLESPHTTTDALLAEKEQKGQKRKKKNTASKVSGSGEVASETPAKKQKQTPKSVKKRKRTSIKDDSKGEEKVLDSDTENDSIEDNEKDTELGKEGDIEPQEDEDAPKEPEAKGRSSSKETVEGTESTSYENSKQEKRVSLKKSGTSSSKSAKSSSNSGKKPSTEKSGTDAEGASGSPSKVKESESKKKKEKEKKEKEKEKEDEESVPSKEKSSKGKSSSKKQPTKPAKDSATDQGKGKRGKKTKTGPTKEEMHAVVVDILKVVDFNTATLSDILKQLSAHFGVDLIDRKADVKEVITDVINNMTDEEDEGEEEEDEKEEDV